MGGFSPLVLFAGGKAGAWYEVSDLTTLFQNANGTGAVAAVNDEVRYIGDKSSNGNHLTILTTGTPGILKRVRGKWIVRCGVGAAFKTTNNKLLSTPIYVCAGLNVTAATSQSMFGVLRSAVQLAVLRGYTIQNRAQSYLNDNATGLISLTSTYEAAPLNAPHVEDTLQVSGTSDIVVEGKSTTTGSNPWTGSAISSAAVYGLNMSSNVAGNSTMTLDVYGGVILHADPGVGARASTVSYFKQKVQRAAVASDNVVLIIGDSTGDGRPGSIDPKEWPWFFALNKIAADDPTAYVGFKLYEEDILEYTAEVIMQEGTGGPPWVFYNCSVAGRTPQYHAGKQFPPGIQNIPRPSVVMWNHGHNIAATGSATVASYQGRFLGTMEQVRQQWPGVPHMAILQNPWRTGTEMTNLVAQLAAVAALYGDMPTANVHQAYLDFVPSKDASLYFNGTDNVHPSEVAGVLGVWMPAINAMWAANWPMPAGAAAFTATKVANALSNGNFCQCRTGQLVTSRQWYADQGRGHR